MYIMQCILNKILLNETNYSGGHSCLSLLYFDLACCTAWEA